MLSRRGATLIELVVAISLASVVLGTATASLLRQQQTHARIGSVSSADAQTGITTSVLASQLAMLDLTAGDLLPSAASDTALQVRAPVAISFACTTNVGSTTLTPDESSTISLSGYTSPIRTGDTLWWLGDSAWTGREITSLADVEARCTTPISATGASTRIGISAPDTIPGGAPIRVTRQTRYALYKSGDGSWQLGFREWNTASGAFTSPQPVAGPLLLRAGTRRSGFTYLDAAGSRLDPTHVPADADRIARIRVTAIAAAPMRSQSQDSTRSDSTDIPIRRRAP
ncbi:MAG: hypothetical protein V4550_12545 [Gemmatimonadota bacterium]